MAKIESPGFMVLFFVAAWWGVYQWSGTLTGSIV
jgi:hypothetical protein